MKTIKIKKTVIAQHYQRFEVSSVWSPQVIIILCVIGLALATILDITFGVMLGFVMFFLIYMWIKKLKSTRRQLKLLDEWQIPQVHLDQLKISYPQLNQQQQQWIIEGFKDYLAMHLWRKQHLAMPSHAVDVLWHSLLRDPISYRAICFKILGRELKHIEYQQHNDLPRQHQRDAYFQAWSMSCKVNGFNPSQTSFLPRLFAIDYLLGLKGNPETFLKDCLVEFKHYLQSGHSLDAGSSGDSSCGGCGGD